MTRDPKSAEERKRAMVQIAEYVRKQGEKSVEVNSPDACIYACTAAIIMAMALLLEE